MSLPRNMASLRKQFYFTLFYTVTTVFAFMNTTIYWFITAQHDAGDSPDPDPVPVPVPVPQPTPQPNYHYTQGHINVQQQLL